MFFRFLSFEGGWVSVIRRFFRGFLHLFLWGFETFKRSSTRSSSLMSRRKSSNIISEFLRIVIFGNISLKDISLVRLEMMKITEKALLFQY